MTRLFALRVIVIASTLSLGEVSVTALDNGDFDRALSYAIPRVFSIRTGNGSGTAVLLKIEESNIGKPVGYFSTCYHVMYKSENFQIYPIGDGNLVTDDKDSSILAVPALDLVIIRSNLKQGSKFNALNPLDDNGLCSTDDSSPIEGFAFGMAGFQTRSLFPARVRLQEIRWADLSGIIDPARVTESDPRLEIRILGRELTYSGMSGGLIVDKDLKFGGLLLGKMPEPNSIPIMITARNVRDLLNKASKEYYPFDKKLFTSAPPYKDDVLQHMNEHWPTSDINWSASESWLRAIDSNPLDLLKNFQEITLDFERLKAYASKNVNDKLSIRVNEDASRVRILFNGVQIAPGKFISPLEPGENLLIISKVPGGGGNRYDISDLFKSDAIDVSFQLGQNRDETVFRLRRILPRIFQGYSIYVTIRNGSIIPRSDYNARLAIPLNYLEDMINQTIFELPIGDSDRLSGSEFSGKAFLEGDKAIQSFFVSPQTLDISARFKISIDKIQCNFAGLRFSASKRNQNDPFRDLSIDMTGRLQFPVSPKSLFFVCARSMGATGPEKQFQLPIFGDDLTIDASGLIRQFLVSYTNKLLLQPETPKSPGPDEVRKFLQSSGLFIEFGKWRWNPLKIFLMQDDRPDRNRTVWAILTLKLLHDGKAVPIDHSPPLLPDKKVRDHLAGEFVAQNIPMHCLKAIHPNFMGKSLWETLEAVDGQTSNLNKVSIAVCRSNVGAKRSLLKLSGNAEDLPGELGKTVIEGLSKSSFSGELLWDKLVLKDMTLEGVDLTTDYTLVNKNSIIKGRLCIKTCSISDYRFSDMKGQFQLDIDPNNKDYPFHFHIKPTSGFYSREKMDMKEKNDMKMLTTIEFNVWISKDGHSIKHDFLNKLIFGNN